MAPLTWRNVDAPDFTGAARILESAGRSAQSGFSGIKDGIGDIRTRQRRERSIPMIDSILNAATEKEAQAALQGIPNQIQARDRSDALLNAMASARGNTLGYEKSRADTDLVGANIGLTGARTAATRNADGRAGAAAGRAAQLHGLTVKGIEQTAGMMGTLLQDGVGADGVATSGTNRLTGGGNARVNPLMPAGSTAPSQAPAAAANDATISAGSGEGELAGGEGEDRLLGDGATPSSYNTDLGLGAGASNITRMDEILSTSTLGQAEPEVVSQNANQGFSYGDFGAVAGGVDSIPLSQALPDTAPLPGSVTSPTDGTPVTKEAARAEQPKSNLTPSQARLQELLDGFDGKYYGSVDTAVKFIDQNRELRGQNNASADAAAREQYGYQVQDDVMEMLPTLNREYPREDALARIRGLDLNPQQEAAYMQALDGAMTSNADMFSANGTADTSMKALSEGGLLDGLPSENVSAAIAFEGNFANAANANQAFVSKSPDVASTVAEGVESATGVPVAGNGSVAPADLQSYLAGLHETYNDEDSRHRVNVDGLAGNIQDWAADKGIKMEYILPHLGQVIGNSGSTNNQLSVNFPALETRLSYMMQDGKFSETKLDSARVDARHAEERNTAAAGLKAKYDDYGQRIALLLSPPTSDPNARAGVTDANRTRVSELLQLQAALGPKMAAIAEQSRTAAGIETNAEAAASQTKRENDALLADVRGTLDRTRQPTEAEVRGSAEVDRRIAESQAFRENSAGSVSDYFPRGGILDEGLGMVAGGANTVAGAGADVLGAGASLFGADRVSAALEKYSDSRYNLGTDQAKNGASAGFQGTDYDMEPAEFAKQLEGQSVQQLINTIAEYRMRGVDVPEVLMRVARRKGVNIQ